MSARLVRFLGAAGMIGAGSVVSASCADADTSGEAPPVEASVFPDVVASDAGTGLCDPDAECVPACHDGEWCRAVSPLEAGAPLLAVRGTAADDVWAVGKGGTILHYDGTSWSDRSYDTLRTLSVVTGTAKNDVWVAGTTKVIAHGAGGLNDWAPVPISDNPLSEGLLAAVALDSQRGIWVGGKCYGAYSLWRNPTGALDPSAWTTATPPMSAPGCVSSTDALWIANASELWAVGQTFDGFYYVGGSLVRRISIPDDGGAPSWSTVDSATDAQLLAIWGAAPNDLWFAGTGGTIRHYLGPPGLGVIASPTVRPLRSLWGFGAADIWAVGDNATILHYDGNAWAIVKASLPEGKPNLYSVWGSAPDDVWAVGEGVILHFGKPIPAAVGGAK